MFLLKQWFIANFGPYFNGKKFGGFCPDPGKSVKFNPFENSCCSYPRNFVHVKSLKLLAICESNQCENKYWRKFAKIFNLSLLKIQFLSRASREWCIKTLNLVIYACFDKEFDFCDYVINRKLKDTCFVFITIRCILLFWHFCPVADKSLRVTFRIC